MLPTKQCVTQKYPKCIWFPSLLPFVHMEGLWKWRRSYVDPYVITVLLCVHCHQCVWCFTFEEENRKPMPQLSPNMKQWKGQGWCQRIWGRTDCFMCRVAAVLPRPVHCTTNWAGGFASQVEPQVGQMTLCSGCRLPRLTYSDNFTSFKVSSQFCITALWWEQKKPFRTQSYVCVLKNKSHLV